MPTWIGGHAEVALARAVRSGDGWHGVVLSPIQSAPRVRRLRADRLEVLFPISKRTRWDGLEDDADQILAELDQYRAIGVTQFVCEPRQRTLDRCRGAIEALCALMLRAGVAMVH